MPLKAFVVEDNLSIRESLVATATANPAVRRECETLGSDGVFDKAMETDALIEWCIENSRARGGR